MQLTQQIVNRTLEGVWISSGEKLVCFWVQRERQFATPVRMPSQEHVADPRRRVA
jgi:hypothetical protein